MAGWRGGAAGTCPPPQVLLNVATRGNRKPEHIKHYHVSHFAPFCQEFLLLLQATFGDQWPQETPRDSEPFRRIYVHGWPFAIKALALAYHDSRRDVLGPLASAIGSQKEEHATVAEAEMDYQDRVARAEPEPPKIPYDEFQRRIGAIDWHRYRKHWIDVTGYKIDSQGRVKTRIIKDPASSDGKKLIVEGQAQNTAAAINTVVNRVLSDIWEELCSDVDAKP
jgi:hypothetical protein